VIYKMLPEVTLPWRDVAIGAFCTAALFSLGEYVIAAYLRRGAITTSFGAAGSLAVLLIWVYYSAQIFFLGAEFTREYALSFGSLRKNPADAERDLKEGILFHLSGKVRRARDRRPDRR